MAVHNRVRPFGFWHTSSTVLSAEFERLDDNGAYSISATGGTYAPADLLTIGGSGVTVSGPFNASDAKVISVDTTLTIELGANLQLTGNQIVNSGAAVGILSGAFLTVSSGGTFTMNAGSTANIAATTTLSGATTISGALTCSNTVALSKGVTITQSTANTNAFAATGNGTGAGASCTGGATGPGIAAVSGTPQTNTAPTCAGTFAGYIQLTGTDPSQGVDPGADNVLHAMAITKVWGNVVLSGGSPYTPVGSYNVDTVEDTATTAEYKVTFKRPMANNFYAVNISIRSVGFAAAVVGLSATDFTFRVYKTDDLTSAIDKTIMFTIVGVQ